MDTEVSTIKNLKNGLTILHTPTLCSNTKTSAIYVFVRVGSIDEEYQERGISHFLEHLLFNGTSKRKSYTEIFKDVDDIGAEMNAYTQRDCTCFHITFPNKYIKEAVDILEDILFHTNISTEKIEKEKLIVMEEENTIRNDAEDLTYKYIFSMIFGEQYLGLDPIGGRKFIQNYNFNLVNKFKNKHYSPNNMIISVSSKYSPEKIFEHLKPFEKHHNLKSSKVDIPFEIPIQTKPQITILEEFSDQYVLGIGYISLGINDPRVYAMNYINVILGRMYSSLLFDDLRTKHNLVYSVLSDIDSYKESGIFMIYCEMDRKNFYKVLERTLIVLNDVATKGISLKIYNKVRKSINNTLINTDNDSSSIAELRGKQYLYKNKTFSDKELIKKYMSVSLKDINQLSKEILDFNKINILAQGRLSKNRILNMIKLYL